jgi:hypothetical protein
MSTISGEESVRPNPAPRQTRPGLTGRKLVLMCANEHRIFAWVLRAVEPLQEAHGVIRAGEP